ncbi:LytTR family DNA-binding domain-containing protein [Rhodobacter sp. TJ_12]|uniref:LytTR family DNA-binding domain-containing protein n=1 Tax=Rhodobacter sp. TJ_12 TaxID=2029399 RepID=UPI001CBD90B8|nr:LytTR family DNA-binding domain-containing protein [Rhodobacter sp. TJ_12]
MGILIGAAGRVSVREYLGYRQFWPEAPLIALLAALLLSPLFWIMLRALSDDGHTMPSIIELGLYTFLISLVISTFRHLLAPAAVTQALAARQSVPVAEAAEPAGRLCARLEPELRAPLIRLQVRDHYVDVVTEAGTGSLLMRLADAIAETEGVPGLRVHRSHWVARAAIAGLRRDKGKYVVQMRDGAEVPVSRSYAPAVLALELPEIGAQETR